MKSELDIKQCEVCACTPTLKLCKYLSQEEIFTIHRNKREVTFHPGEIIFKEGMTATHIACLRSGLAKAYTEGSKGKRLLMGILTPTEFVGGMGMYVDDLHHFSVAALTETRICLIDIRDFKEVLSQNNFFCQELIKRNNGKAIKSLKSTLNLTQKNMHGRVADAILYFKESIFKSDVYEIPLSRQELADMVSLTKESLIRIIKEFKQAGYITVQQNNLVILNEEALKKVSINS
ncbi:MAG: Crp/Fnr family transcriptional regulator [Bacteroidales bacterium]|nr:Crp/Fnr family transcriptional regulator [Bacteroidales bacterium]